MQITGRRKFYMGIIGLSLLFVVNVTMLIVFLHSLISGDRFVDFIIESGKVVGIIVSAFMATNIGEHIVGAIKNRGKEKGKNED